MIRVVVGWGHCHSPHAGERVAWYLFNSNNFATSAALADVCAVLSVILVFNVVALINNIS